MCVCVFITDKTTPIIPGFPSTTTLMFNRPSGGILPRSSRQFSQRENDNSNHTTLAPQTEDADTYKKSPF